MVVAEVRKQVTNVQRIQKPIMARNDRVGLSGGDETKYMVELTDEHADGGATCVEEQVDSVRKEKTEVVFTLNMQEEAGSVERIDHNSLEANQPDLVRAEVVRLNMLQRDLEDDEKFGEEDSQGSGRKKIRMRKVIVPAKRGQKLKGPRAIATRIDDFLDNFHVEGGGKKKYCG